MKTLQVTVTAERNESQFVLQPPRDNPSPLQALEVLRLLNY